MQEHEFTTIYCATCGHHFIVPVYCKNRFCELCSLRRSRRIRHRLNQLISTIVDRGQWNLKFLTLTVPNSPDARSAAKLLIASFRKLRRSKFWRERVDGGCFVLEITGAPGSWHVHLHAVLYAAFLPWDMLVDLWERCSGARGVYVKRIPRSAALAYLSKYLVKENSDLGTTSELSAALKSFRLFQPFGTWHNKLKPEPKPPYLCPKCHSENWLPECYLSRRSRGENPIRGTPYVGPAPPRSRCAQL